MRHRLRVAARYLLLPTHPSPLTHTQHTTHASHPTPQMLTTRALTPQLMKLRGDINTDARQRICRALGVRTGAEISRIRRARAALVTVLRVFEEDLADDGPPAAESEGAGEAIDTSMEAMQRAHASGDRDMIRAIFRARQAAEPGGGTTTPTEGNAAAAAAAAAATATAAAAAASDAPAAELEEDGTEFDGMQDETELLGAAYGAALASS